MLLKDACGLFSRRLSMCLSSAGRFASCLSCAYLVQESGPRLGAACGLDSHVDPPLTRRPSGRASVNFWHHQVKPGDLLSVFD